MSEPRERIAAVLASLRLGTRVTQDEIREMGRLAKRHRIEREAQEPYDSFLHRILEKVRSK